jgi:hypothetical protein
VLLAVRVLMPIERSSSVSDMISGSNWVYLLIFLFAVVYVCACVYLSVCVLLLRVESYRS